MANDFSPFSQSGNVAGSSLATALRMVRDGAALLQNHVNAMSRMIEGDGSQVTQFPVVVSQYGFAAGTYADANTAAHAAWSEISSLANILGAQSPGSYAPGAAITQACAKLGV